MLSRADLLAMLPAWSTAYHAAGDDADLLIHPDRIAYHRNALEALLQGDKPMSALWLLVHTWAAASASLLEYGPEYVAWKAVFERLGWWATASKGRSRRWTGSWTKPRKCWTPYLPITVCPDPSLAVYFGGIQTTFRGAGDGDE